jgi:hypothetical protein
LAKANDAYAHYFGASGHLFDFSSMDTGNANFVFNNKDILYAQKPQARLDGSSSNNKGAAWLPECPCALGAQRMLPPRSHAKRAITPRWPSRVDAKAEADLSKGLLDQGLLPNRTFRQI